jgi:pyridoxamine-phosphate oxidase
MVQWQRWHADAFEVGVAEPNAMTLGTVDVDGTPDARIVLVRGADDRGFAFFTNYTSVKSRQLDALGAASAVFSWLDLHRQVRVRGRVERLDAESSDAYFASRPRPSQIGAWASPQSEVIADRAELEGLGRRRRRAVRRVRRPPPAALGRMAAGAPTCSSSGRVARAASTIASATAATAPPGTSTASPPDPPGPPGTVCFRLPEGSSGADSS